MVAAVAIVDTSAIVGVAESLWAGRRQLYGKPADRIHNATCDLGHVASLKLTKKEMTYRCWYEMRWPPRQPLPWLVGLAVQGCVWLVTSSLESRKDSLHGCCDEGSGGGACGVALRVAAE